MSRVRTISNTTATSGFTSTTSTGTLPEVDLRQVVRDVEIAVSHPSTKPITWKAQGSLGDLFYKDILAVDSTTTGTATFESAVTGLYNRVRIVITGNDTTGNITTTWTVGGAP